MTFHHPMFSNEPARNNPTQRATWLPLFENYGVDLVLQGHDHSYARGNVIAGHHDPGRQRHDVRRLGLRPQDVRARTTPTGPRTAPSWRKMLTDTQLCQVISRRRRPLTYKAKTATGRLHDQFTIDKPAGQAKIITEDLANVQPAAVGAVVPGTLSLSLRRRSYARLLHARRDQGLRGRRHRHHHEPTAADATLTVVDPSADQRRASSSTARSRSHSRSRPPLGRLRGGRRLAAVAAQLQRPDRERPGDDPVQAVHRRDRAAAHRQLRQGAHAHAVDDLSVTPGSDPLDGKLGCVTQPTDTERVRTFTWSDPLATAAAAAIAPRPRGDPQDRRG